MRPEKSESPSSDRNGGYCTPGRALILSRGAYLWETSPCIASWKLELPLKSIKASPMESFGRELSHLPSFKQRSCVAWDILVWMEWQCGIHAHNSQNQGCLVYFNGCWRRWKPSLVWPPLFLGELRCSSFTSFPPDSSFAILFSQFYSMTYF